VVQLHCSQLQRPEQDLDVIFNLKRSLDVGIYIGMHPAVAAAVQINESPLPMVCTIVLKLMKVRSTKHLVELTREGADGRTACAGEKAVRIVMLT
jgi:hypothetical protein